MTAFVRTLFRARLTILLSLASWALWTPLNVVAHRLDECLQAARIAVSETRVEIELDITSGAEVATRFLALLDLDRDDRISATEGEAFAERVNNSLSLKLDGVAKALQVVVEELPSLPDIKAGTGIIRLRLSGEYPALSRGGHRITIKNRYQPVTSVYLSNALVPDSKRIQVTRQQRDSSQRDYEVEFTVK